jgi:hypothetical protein|tara:strand:+ start:765 stop:866 length:102 start_codon:yes stop_codon:yes gene_type:complete
MVEKGSFWFSAALLANAKLSPEPSTSVSSLKEE